MDNDFYITINSNSSKNYFPDNVANNFKIHLGRQIHIDGDYELGLSEIHYPMTVCNIHGHARRIWYQDVTKKSVVYIPEAYYKDAAAVFEAADRVLPTVLEDDGFIVLSEELTNILGFRNRKMALEVFKARDTQNATCIDAGLPQTLYVHCNIITPQLVGEGVEKLLRIVPMRTTDYKFGCEDVQLFLKPHYIKIEKENIDTIEILIVDARGEKITFSYGAITLVLHFRKIRS